MRLSTFSALRRDREQYYSRIFSRIKFFYLYNVQKLVWAGEGGYNS